MRKNCLAVLLIILLVCVFSLGCTAEPEATSPVSASPTATPPPQPTTGLEAVFGKEEVTLCVISNLDGTDLSMFLDGTRKEAQSMGIKLTAADGTDSLSNAAAGAVQNGADALIVCLAEEQQSYQFLDIAADSGIPVCIFEMQPGAVAAGVSQLVYDPDEADDMALDAALVYPPHDTPVRLILMFESRESAAYLTYETLYAQGKIFPKEIYVASEDEAAAPGAWLEEKLNDYVEGMLDGVFAENTVLALGALDTLETLDRTDMEVFSIGLTSTVISRMSQNPDVYVQAVGVNTPLAGVLSVRVSLNALYGGEPVSLTLEPVLADAADFGQDAIDALINTDETLSDLYNESWMDTLREYVANQS